MDAVRVGLEFSVCLIWAGRVATPRIFYQLSKLFEPVLCCSRLVFVFREGGHRVLSSLIPKTDLICSLVFALVFARSSDSFNTFLLSCFLYVACC